jgi:DNA-binding SARP family transcriptional activator
MARQLVVHVVGARPNYMKVAPVYEALEQRGNVAEALRAYERLRVLLREELGITPSPTVQGVHRRLLQSAGS